MARDKGGFSTRSRETSPTAGKEPRYRSSAGMLRSCVPVALCASLPAEFNVGLVCLTYGVVCLAFLAVGEIGALLGGPLPGIGERSVQVFAAVAGERW